MAVLYLAHCYCTAITAVRNQKRKLDGKTYQTIDQAITQSVSLPQQPLPSGNSNAFNVPASGMEHGGQNTVEPKDNSISYHPVRDILSLFANHIWLIWFMVALILLVQKINGIS